MSEPRACTMAETGARARKGSGRIGGVSGHQKKTLDGCLLYIYMIHRHPLGLFFLGEGGRTLHRRQYLATLIELRCTSVRRVTSASAPLRGGGRPSVGSMYRPLSVSSSTR